MKTAREIQHETAVYLSRYLAAKGEVQDIEERIERIRDEMMGIKGINYESGDMPTAEFRTGDLSDYVARIDDLIQAWKRAQMRALATMKEVSCSIEGVRHDQARRVLMLHFIDDYKYEEIAEKIPCAVDTVYRWRRIGLMEVKVNSK